MGEGTKKRGWIKGRKLTKILVVDEAKCVGCGQGLLVCEFDAVEVRYGLSRVKPEDCVACCLPALGREMKRFQAIIVGLGVGGTAMSINSGTYR